MKRETLEKANELERIEKTIKKIEDVLRAPYPYIKDNNTEICFVGLGGTIGNQLKDIIRDFLEKKKEEINKEFDEL